MTQPAVDIRRSARRHKTVTVFRENGRIVALAPARLPRRELEAILPDLVARLLRREAARLAPAEPDALARRGRDLFDRYVAPVEQEELPPFRATWVSNQVHRWGSCTPVDGTIRLSDRLRAMPAWVVDYVLLHEVLHLIEQGHTPRFHTLLSLYPRCERARGYLEGYQAGESAPTA